MQHQLEPDIPVNLCYAFRIHGPLNSDVLQKALDSIIERHEILRTTYAVVNGDPVQVVTESRSVNIQHVDLSTLPQHKRENAIQRKHDEESLALFDLSRDLMLRTVLLKISDVEHVLILTMHHIATDEWSMHIFFSELLALYTAFAEDKASPLPALPIQYADFASWRRQWMTGEKLQQNLSYWKGRLHGCPASLDLPTDHPRPKVGNMRGANYSITLPAELTASLAKLSEREGATIFTVMMAAFKTLLFRYTGENDICVGTFLPNRNWREIRELIGFFVNMLVIRTDLSDGPSFRELLRREGKSIDDAFAHYDMPFEVLVEALNPVRDPGRSPLFQVALWFDEDADIDFTLPGMKSEMLDSEPSISLFDLSLLVTTSSDHMKLTYTYRTDLFEASTIRRFADNLTTLLEHVASCPEHPVSTVPILSHAERKMILDKWSCSSGKPQTGPCIHHLFEAQAERTPEAIALVYDDVQMTYGQLNRRANQLAHYLRKLGVRPEVLVGLCADRSPEMIVGILGILKAGGAYVPLDPDYPKERLDLMVNDTGIPVLLTHSHLSVRMSPVKGKVVLLDSDWNNISRGSKDNPLNISSPDDAACIFYTSGSTGTPKGAVIQHGALVNFTRAVISEYGLRPSDRVLQFASINFDASAEEIYPCLAIGATLVLRTNEMLTDRDFLDRCNKWQLNVLSLPTAYWHMLVLGLETEKLLLPSSVRLVIIGGERALPERLSLWQKNVGHRVRLLNTYGPTEATVAATLFDLTSWDAGQSREVPIGRPLLNSETYILDHCLQPVPAGITGELYIGGNSLARGYLNRPDISAERFIPNPFSNIPEARLYKTGDLARYRHDGLIEFMGRADHQVKIRGFRIELGEIEACLRQHPAIKEAVVVAQEDRPGEKKLISYVVSRKETADLGNELRAYLAKRLPNYMVPAVFATINALPLTRSNKVDMTALRVSARDAVSHDNKHLPPQNSLELLLTKIWERVLGIGPVGTRDNFFDLGGHSLLAVRLISEIKRSTGKNLPVISVFQYPTIEQLAELLREEYQAEQLSALKLIQPKGTNPPLFWVHGWKSDALLPRYLDANQPVYGFSDPERNGRLVSYHSINEIAALYLREMRAVQPRGPYFLGGYCFGGIIALEMAQQIFRDGDNVPFVFLIELPSECLPDGPSQVSDKPHCESSHAARVLSILKKIARLKFSEKTDYISRNTRYVFRRTLNKADEAVKLARCRVYDIRKQPLPYDLRHFYLMNMYAHAMINYKPRAYPGHAVMFQADRGIYSSREDWGRLASGGLAMHTIQGSGHVTILEEPYIEKWAVLINEYLVAAQKRIKDKPYEDVI